MDKLQQIHQLRRPANLVLDSLILNLEWFDRQLLQWTNTAVESDKDALLEKLFSTQTLIMEAITKLKIASEVFNPENL